MKGVTEPFSAARLMTTETKRPVAGYLWTQDSKFIVYAKDHDGDENFNVYAVDPGAKAAAGEEAPPSRDLTGLKGVRVMLYDAPKSDPDILYMGLNDRDKAWHDLYKLKISTGEKTLVRKNTDRITGWSFDLKGDLRLAVRSADNGDTEIMRVDADKLTQIYSCSVFESCNPLHFRARRHSCLHGDQQGHRPGFAGYVRPADRQDGDGGVRSVGQGGFRRRALLGKD